MSRIVREDASEVSTISDIDPLTRNQLFDLVAEFNWKLDHGEPGGFAELFTPDGTFAAGPNERRGRGELQAFAEMRTSQDKTSRTVIGQHRLERVSAEEIHGSVQYILFMVDGRPTPPPSVFAVGEYVDVYRLEGGTWRIAARRSETVFKS